MPDDPRPDPDVLLAHLQREEKRKKRGRLKIFLGYAAGVGKTYGMLKAAHERQKEGVDVRIGFVETHGRVETEELVTGLPLIPRVSIPYKTTLLSEMDLDEILRLHPQLVLVDELAHSNPPGFRHAKRYQDVEELLEAGIDVYTTLNIQHLESLHDVVAKITSVIVRETIPDRVIDEADEIELMDLPPVDLLQRLSEGKVYVADMAERALNQFFNEGNLFALRELSLRKTAERVDSQMLEYMQTRAIPGPWQTTEHLLVSIGPGPFSEYLVRAAKRQADRMNADWRAVYVETPSHHRLSQDAKNQVWKTIKLAESLGAKTETLFGTNVPETLIPYAKKHNITKIIIGKTLRPRWKELLYGSIVDRMIHISDDIDVYVISSSKMNITQLSSSDQYFKLEHLPGGYAESFVMVALLTIFGEITRNYLNETNLMMLYLMVVVIAAFRNGLYRAIFTAIIGVLAFDFFFVLPYYTFMVSDSLYFISFLVMLLVGVIISFLISQVQDYAIAAQSRERENALLFNLAKDLTAAMDRTAICSVIITKIEQNFAWKSVILLSDGNNLEIAESSEDLVITEDEKAVAIWAYSKNMIAGYDTDTLHACRLRFIPIRGRKEVSGVLGVQPSEEHGIISPDQGRILEIFADLAGMALERLSPFIIENKN